MSLELLPTTANGHDVDEMLDELTQLRAENARLRTAPRSRHRTTLAVSAKGAVSVYGLGRWPVTLYREQMLTLLAMGDEIRAFMTEHGDDLATKPVK